MYKKMKLTIASTAVACLFPFASYANFLVTNNSHFYATADAVNPSTSWESACSSSIIGDAGIMKPIDQAPNNRFDIPTGAIGFFCSPTCDVTVYLSKSCDGRKVAVVPISPANGIGEPTNLPNAEGVYISRKNNHEVTIEGGPKATIFDLMFRKLGV